MRSLFLTLVAPLSFATIAMAAVETKPYSIHPGDTLSQIAKSLYGSWDKYKELWQMNKDRILNPNLIYPGQRLRLIDGGEIELAQNDEPNSPASDAGHIPQITRRGYSDEWKLLPKQSWETFTFKVSPLVDPNGIDRRSKIGIKYKDSINLPAIVTADPLPIMGQITAGRSESDGFSLGDQVLISAQSQIQVGMIYTITDEAKVITSARDGRSGNLYRLSGRLRIVGVRDRVFVGTIIQSTTPIFRGQQLLTEVPKAKSQDAIATTKPITASVIEDQEDYSIQLGANRIVFLDVGTADGIQPGSVFRRYQHTDPGTHETISSQDFLVDAEMKVIQADSKFCTVLVLNGRSEFARNDEVVSVTDVSDLGRHLGLQGSLQPHPSSNLNDLDQADANSSVGSLEGRDLKQLETLPLDQEIKVQEVNKSGRKAVELGRENGPDDHSGVPEAKPAPQTESAPPTESAPALDSPPPITPSDPFDTPATPATPATPSAP